MSTFNLTHTGQQVDDAIRKVRFDTVATLITYLQGLSSLPPTGSVFTTNGRTTAGDTPIRTLTLKDAPHTDNGGTIRTVTGNKYLEISDWDGDVRDFGAVGDGVTDDTVAIQAAMTAAANDYVTLIIPAGTYLVTSGLTTPLPLFIEGEGAHLSTIKFNCVATFTGISFGASATFGKLSGIRGLGLINAGVDGTYCIKTPAQADQYDTYDQKFLFEHIVIRGDTFTGGGAYYPVTDQTFTSGHLFIGDCKFCQIRDIKINGGFDVNSDPTGQVVDEGIVIDPVDTALTVRLENLEINAVHTAFAPDGNSFYSMAEFDFIGVYRGVYHLNGNEAKIHTGIINCQDTGIYMQDSFSRSIDNVDVQRLSSAWSGATNDWYGFRFNNVDDVTVTGCKFAHGSGTYGGGFTVYNIYAEGGTASINIGNCNFSTGTDRAVQLDNVAGFNINDSMLSSGTAMIYVYLANNSRYGSILGVAFSTISITHTMIADDGSVSDTSYLSLTENVTGFNRLPAGGELTIASGSITPTRSFHLVDTEADAATDDLTDIVPPTYFPQYIELELRPISSGRTVVVKDNAGTGSSNIQLAGGDFSMDSAIDWIKLVYEGGQWKEVSRSNNA